MNNDYEALRRRKRKSIKSGICFAIGVFTLLLAVIALVLLGIFLWNWDPKINLIESNSTKSTSSSSKLDDSSISMTAIDSNSKMIEGLIGDWRLISSENYEEILEHFGVNYFLRKIAVVQKPTVKIAYNENSNKWSLTIVASIKTIKLEFEISKEFDEDLQDGRKTKTTFQIEDKKLIQIQKDRDGNVVCVTTRQLISNDEHWVIIEAGNIVAKRVFQRIK